MQTKQKEAWEIGIEEFDADLGKRMVHINAHEIAGVDMEKKELVFVERSLGKPQHPISFYDENAADLDRQKYDYRKNSAILRPLAAIRARKSRMKTRKSIDHIEQTVEKVQAEMFNLRREIKNSQVLIARLYRVLELKGG